MLLLSLFAHFYWALFGSIILIKIHQIGAAGDDCPDPELFEKLKQVFGSTQKTDELLGNETANFEGDDDAEEAVEEPAEEAEDSEQSFDVSQGDMSTMGEVIDNLFDSGAASQPSQSTANNATKTQVAKKPAASKAKVYVYLL